jgi:hypothetical protein
MKFDRSFLEVARFTVFVDIASLLEVQSPCLAILEGLLWCQLAHKAGNLICEL